ncbi:hypothetical protein TNCV_655961 [Trichonephila clavipes]|nr:hypothetical protein TNCV_655961 [Trichonephila clavipes]
MILKYFSSGVSFEGKVGIFHSRQELRSLEIFDKEQGLTSRFVDNKQWGLAMSERSRLPDSLRWSTVRWMEMGLSQAYAARRLDVSPSVVHRLWNQY